MASNFVIDRLKSIVYWTYVHVNAQIKEYLRWRGNGLMSSSIRVFYGHEHIPAPGEMASGGIIKYQDLQRDYPNCKEGANIVYLVSSALPSCPKILVQHAKKRGAKLIVNQNGVAFPAYHGKRIERMNRPRRYLLQHADHVIYQSQYCKLSSDIFLTDKISRYSILYNPVDTNFFIPRPGVKKEGQLTLLMAGSHGFLYRVDSGVKTLAVLRNQGVNACLKIYGRLAWKQDPALCKRELMALCKEYGVENFVELGRPYRQIDAPSIYQSADVLIHTQYNDACPRTVVEAMACGLPVVYSKSGGTPELVGADAGIGVHVPLDWNNVHYVDPDQMAQSVRRVMESNEKFSAAARERACRDFDVKKWLSAHKEILSSVLSGEYSP